MLGAPEEQSEKNIIRALDRLKILTSTTDITASIPALYYTVSAN